MGEYFGINENPEGGKIVEMGLNLTKMGSKLFPDSYILFISRINFYTLIFNYYPLSDSKMKKIIKESFSYLEKSKNNFSENEDILYREAELYGSVGTYLFDSLKDPTPFFEKASKIYEKIIKTYCRRKKVETAIFNKAVDEYYLAQSLYLFHGKNPEKYIEKSITDLKRKLHINPNHILSYLAMSDLYLSKSNFSIWNEGDLKTSVKNFKENIEAAKKINPDYEYLYYLDLSFKYTAIKYHKIFPSDPEKTLNAYYKILKIYKKKYPYSKDIKYFARRYKNLKFLIDFEKDKNFLILKNEYMVFLTKLLKTVKSNKEYLNGELYPLFIYIESKNFKCDKNILLTMKKLYLDLMKLKDSTYFTDRELMENLLYMAACYKNIGEKDISDRLIRKAFKVLKKYDENLIEEKFFLALIDIYRGKDVEKNKNFLKGLIKRDKFYKTYFSRLVKEYIKSL